MSKSLIAILIMLLMMSPSGAGIFTASTTILPVKQLKVEKELAKEREEQAKINAELAAKQAEEDAFNKLHTFLGMTEDEVVGYGSFKVPYSHYNINKTKSTDTKRVYNYYDSISYVEFYSTTDLTDNDKAEAGKNILNMIDNPEIESIQISGIDAVRLVSEEDYNGYKRESYIVYKDKSAFIIDAYLTEDTDRDAFRESIELIVPTLRVYYVSKLVFDLPTTGYWATLQPNKENNSSNIQTPEYNSSNKEGYETYVGGEIRGTVKTNLVSSNWKDLRIVLDGLVIDMLDKVDVLIDDGYKFADESKIPETVAPNEVIKTFMYKDNGVAVKIEAMNTTESSSKPGNLTIIALEVFKDKFGYYTNDSEYTPDNLPEMIIVNGITWDIWTDDLEELNGDDYYIREESDGTFILTYDQQLEYMQIKTENYKNIKEIELRYDYMLFKKSNSQVVSENTENEG